MFQTTIIVEINFADLILMMLEYIFLVIWIGGIIIILMKKAIQFKSPNIYLGNTCQGQSKQEGEIVFDNSPGNSPGHGAEKITGNIINLQPTVDSLAQSGTNIIIPGVIDGIAESPRAGLLVLYPDNIERFVPEHLKDEVRTSHKK